MSMQDPIADMLTRIRNGQSAHKRHITVAYSKFKLAVAKVLLDEGYIRDVEMEGEAVTERQIKITLKYHNGTPVIDKIKRVSRPGLRVYSSVAELPKVLNGMGVLVVSTPAGVMSDAKARAAGVGGEIICEVY